MTIFSSIKSADLRAASGRLAFSRARAWRWPEIAFWVVAAASLFLLPAQHLILNEIAILALFALSIDIVLGFAGVVTLGQAAFFGFGAYSSALFANHVTGDPVLGLVAGAAAAALLAFATSFLILRGSDLTRLMVTLGVAAVVSEIANKASWLTGGADGMQGITVGPIFGLFDFDIYGHTGYAYSLSVLFVLFIVVRIIMAAPFGFALRAIRDNPLRASAIGIPVRARLVAGYTLAGAYAGVAGALVTQTQQFVSLDVLSFQKSADGLMVLVIGGTGYLYGGPIGAIVYKIIQDTLSTISPQFWPFWVGLLLVTFVLAGRERPHRFVMKIIGRYRRGTTDPYQHSGTIP